MNIGLSSLVVASMCILATLIFVFLGTFNIIPWSAVGPLATTCIGIASIIIALYERNRNETSSAKQQQFSRKTTLNTASPKITIKPTEDEQIAVKLHILSLGRKWDVHLPWDIRTGDAARSISQELKLQAKIGELSIYNLPPSILMDGKILNEQKTLRENGVKSGSILHLTFREPLA